MIRRVGVAIAVAAIVSLSACTQDKGATPPGGSPSASASATAVLDPKALADLQAAMSKSVAGTYQIRAEMHLVKAGDAGRTTLMTMQTDTAAQRMLMTTETDGSKVEMRLIGTDIYLAGVPQLKGKWMHADASAIPGYSEIFNTFDQNLALFSGVVELTAAPDGTYRGVADPKVALANATTESRRNALAKLIKAGGDSQRLPFTAKVSDGYLVEWTTEYSIEQNNVVIQAKVAMTLSEFGQPVEVSAPPKDQIVQAPTT